jgi:hypothetical protein
MIWPLFTTLSYIAVMLGLSIGNQCLTNCLSLQNLQNQSDQSSSSHVKKKVESNKKTRDGLSSESKLIESITYSGADSVPVMEHLLSGSENVSNINAKIGLEEHTRNRGDAMLRYKEKKKTRRYYFMY